MDGLNLSGERIDIPIGFNFILPESSPLGGHRIGLEANYPIFHKYNARGVQLGLDWGLTLGYQINF